MDTNDLFEQPQNITAAARRIARRHDPATSHAAAADVAPQLNTLQERFVQAVRSMGEATATEAARYCHVQHGGNSETYRKRARECYVSGHVKLGNVRRCRITGKQAATYVPIDAD